MRFYQCSAISADFRMLRPLVDKRIYHAHAGENRAVLEIFAEEGGSAAETGCM